MLEKALKMLKHLRRQGTPIGAHKRPPEITDRYPAFGPCVAPDATRPRTTSRSVEPRSLTPPLRCHHGVVFRRGSSSTRS